MVTTDQPHPGVPFHLDLSDGFTPSLRAERKVGTALGVWPAAAVPWPVALVVGLGLDGGCGIPLERITLLVGHSSRATIEAVCRRQLRPVITQGAEAMDLIFTDDGCGEGA
ncbi:hypothetical protein ACWDE9_04525 [Streptomyces olivaceoviridis]